MGQTPCQTCARAGNTWKKETVCLRFKDQTKGPDCTEKMELARIGLGLEELSFDGDGDALHIHSVLLTAFKQLDACGGYTLLHLATNSTDLIEIQPPKGGMDCAVSQRHCEISEVVCETSSGTY